MILCDNFKTLIMKNLFFLFFFFFGCPVLFAQEGISILPNSFQSDCPVIRAERPFRFRVIVKNGAKKSYECRLILPKDGSTQKTLKATTLPSGAPYHSWDVVCKEPGQKDFSVELVEKGKVIDRITVSQVVLEPRRIEKRDYVPEPKPVKTDFLVGAHNCPLWDKDYMYLWKGVIENHQERTPALGYYLMDNPEVADWETVWALDHGISFFIYCWYRDSQGGAVRTRHEKSILDDAFFKSRYGNQMNFTIMWENGQRGKSGISDLADLRDNLMPYWIEKFFKRDNYLKIDNKPVLFIYRPTGLAEDLGGDDVARKAIDLMRRMCKEAGFDGLYVLGEYRGSDPLRVARMAAMGMDYTFAYCWHVDNNPSPATAIESQLRQIAQIQALHYQIPQVVTFTQAWSGWHDESSIWKLPPRDYETLLRRGRKFIEEYMPKGELGSRMILLDNWNEWGEGHYIAPYREYGFGYLDAVRRVFAPGAPQQHEDLLPEDIGLGPYTDPSLTIYK